MTTAHGLVDHTLFAVHIYVMFLTLVGEAEGYCNHSKPMNISTLKILPADFKLYKDHL